MSELDVSGLKIAVVSSLFNRPVTEKLESAALQFLEDAGLKKEQLQLVQVPGALEIPLAAKALFEKGVDGVVAVGAVIRGETTHYESVCAGVERGCSHLQLEYMRPLGNGVITTENAQQAYDRCGGSKGNKGAEAAEVTLQMIKILKNIL